MNLYVIRHPEPIGAEGLCYGITDLDISDDSLQATLEHIKNIYVDKTTDLLLSSPLTRCRKLADQLGVFLQIDPAFDDRLIEMNFGVWEGVPWDDIDPDSFAQWSDDYVLSPAPEGESFSDVLVRVENLLQELNATSVQTVVMVAHAGVIRALISTLLDIPLQSTWRFAVSFGSMLQFSLATEQWQTRLISMSKGA